MNHSRCISLRIQCLHWDSFGSIGPSSIFPFRRVSAPGQILMCCTHTHTPFRVLFMFQSESWVLFGALTRSLRVSAVCGVCWESLRLLSRNYDLLNAFCFWLIGFCFNLCLWSVNWSFGLPSNCACPYLSDRSQELPISNVAQHGMLLLRIASLADNLCRLLFIMSLFIFGLSPCQRYKQTALGYLVCCWWWC